MNYNYFISTKPVNYNFALANMSNIIYDIKNSNATNSLWLLEHPSIYTAGVSAQKKDLLKKDQYPVITTNRGGQYTYHGPGQRIAYIMFNLKDVFKENQCDVRIFVSMIEDVIINTLQDIGINGFRRQGRIGVWVDTLKGEKKIAAIGIKIRSWVSFHGLAINLDPDLSAYKNIVPCGIAEYGVTSIKELGYDISYKKLDEILINNFNKVFNASSNFISAPEQIQAYN